MTDRYTFADGTVLRAGPEYCLDKPFTPDEEIVTREEWDRRHPPDPSAPKAQTLRIKSIDYATRTVTLEG